MRRFITGLVALIAAGLSKAQDFSNLEAGLHAVLASGDLLNLQSLSDSLGLMIAPAPANEQASSFRGTLLHVPPTMYASGLSYSVRIDQERSRTFVNLHFVPHTCWSLKQWAGAWAKPVHTTMLTDAAGSSESIQWNGTTGVELSATYFTGGNCAFDLSQTLDRAAMPQFLETAVERVDTSFDQQIASLVRHGDLRDYRWTANVLHANLKTAMTAVRDGLLFNGGLLLDQVIPGIKDFQYFANDTGWHDHPGAIFYLGQKLAARYVSLRLSFDTERTCVAPAAFVESFHLADIAFRDTQTQGNIRYEVAGNNPMSITLTPGWTKTRQCVADVELHQLTDVKHSVKVPVEFMLRDALRADQLSDTASEQVGLILQAVQGKTIKQITIIALASEESGQTYTALTRLAALLRTRLVDQGIAAELVQGWNGVPMLMTREPNADAKVAIDVLIQ